MLSRIFMAFSGVFFGSQPLSFVGIYTILPEKKKNNRISLTYHIMCLQSFCLRGVVVYRNEYRFLGVFLVEVGCEMSLLQGRP